MRQHYNPNTDPRRPTRAWEVIVCLAALIASAIMAATGL
jgi:hypothetical protein